MNKLAKQILEENKKHIINGTMTMSKSYLMWPEHDSFPIFIDSLDGCIAKSVDGEEFIDIMGGSGTNFLPQKIVKKSILEQVKKGLNFSLPSVLETELAKLWSEMFGLQYVKFCKNGSDATSAAIRAARCFTKKDKILMINNGYHGWGDFFASASDRNFGIPTSIKNFIEKIPFNDLDIVEQKLKTNEFATFIIEPVSLEEPKQDYLIGIRKICDKYGCVLIFDETITGFRFAPGSCAELLYNTKGDIITVGKAVGSGMPLSGLLFSDKLYSAFKEIFFSGTNFGECLSLKAGIATAKYIKQNKDTIYKNIWKNGNKFIQMFNHYCNKLNIKATTLGMAPRINVKFEYENGNLIKDLWHIEMLKRNILIGNQIYITPCIKQKHMKKILNALEQSLNIISETIKYNKIEEKIGFNCSQLVFKRT